VRDRAVRLIAAEDAYAAILISMHTYNLLTEHADRSTIAPAQLPLLDQFLVEQKALQESLRHLIATDLGFTPEQASESAILDHFRLLQATDNLSLLTCVDFRQPAHLLHPLPFRDGTHKTVQVRSAGTRDFVLSPYPFGESTLSFEFPARFVEGKTFSSAGELQQRFDASQAEILTVTVSAA
jgi:Protein of unknown function (DUF3891)